MLELRNVSYKVGSKCILQDINLCFKQNSFNVIIGANGAGKTTLLKIATALFSPTSGEVLLNEKSIQSLSTKDLALTRAVLSQSYDIAFSLSIRDVVLMGRYPYFNQNPNKVDFEIANYAIEKVGMQQQINQDYTTLSGGEKQKVQLARVLAQIWNEETISPVGKYLFLDEPISNLDVKYQLEILKIAQELTNQNITVVAVLHDINLALQFGNQFYFLQEGKKIFETDDKKKIDKKLLENLFDVNATQINNIEFENSIWHFSSK